MQTCMETPFDSASRRAECRAIMAAITRLSNIAMVYVHNFREWRTLLHLAVSQNAYKLNHEAMPEHSRTTTGHVKHTDFVSPRDSNKMRESESCKGERAACTECKSLKYRSRVPPQGAWIFTFVSCKTVLHINALY